jgi:hypothetical protein
MQVKMLEILEIPEVIEHQNGHYFALGHLCRTITAAFAAFRQLFEVFDCFVKFLAKFVCNTENLFMHVF